MKKYLLLVLLFCLQISARAQSITFNDLTNLANLSDGQAHTYLTLGRVFKHEYIEEVDGKQIEHFRSISPKESEQTIIIGVNKVLPNTAVLHTITYTSRNPQHILNLVAQARRTRLVMQFQGADTYNNIYVFDNDFYRVSMYISTTENKGSVRIDQKEYVAY
ncbi:hypothetical protein [Mucilaginibacter psychrotolerans]|uniref:DUF4251 domain-containing protein n=1 Tax=Mucilaginibacter psychrotolerans TaxID=1524096 RepID=A0A4Y8S7H5_9SPHI|nr:hypothetical protein [Mucilaginibacter psychrotolerans]TFF34334.1 hypothetical protein E2R66_22640 [Mucilaginibacter psychrotolerans]